MMPIAASEPAQLGEGPANILPLSPPPHRPCSNPPQLGLGGRIPPMHKFVPLASSIIRKEL